MPGMIKESFATLYLINADVDIVIRECQQIYQEIVEKLIS